MMSSVVAERYFFTKRSSLNHLWCEKIFRRGEETCNCNLLFVYSLN